MKVLVLARMGLALFLYVVTLVFVIWPTGMMKRGMMARAGASQAFQRSANAAHTTIWASRLAAMARYVIGFRVRLRLPDNVTALPRHPRIYESNHRSALDAIIVPLVALAMGDTDIRWVIKRALLRVPFLGGVMSDCGYGEVLRRKDVPRMSDVERRRANELEMNRYLRRAREDGASVGIFPEGERFTGATPGARWRHVGEPRSQGFRLACERLPGYPVVSITVLWPPDKGGKTVFDIGEFLDRTIDVLVEVHPPVRPEDAAAYLDRSWQAKERAIAANAESLTT